MPKKRMTAARKAQIAKWQSAGANSRKAAAGSRIKRWSASELAEPRRISSAQKAAQAHIDALKKKVGSVDLSKPLPTGKTVLLFHRTSVEAAKSIVREGFSNKKGHKTPGLSNDEKNHAFFVHPKTVDNWRGYGEAIVGVKVPRKLIKKDETMSTYYPAPVKVLLSDLKGRKVRRFK